MLVKKLAHSFLKAGGWTVLSDLPEGLDKFVIIAAPHTSNWDFPVTLAVATIIDIELYWVGKDSLFKGPMGPIMRRLGGIPVDRNRSTNFVDQVAQAIKDSDRMALGIAPEGTRSRSDYWTSGFYHIARAAGVPIVCGYMDWEKKIAGLGPIIDASRPIEEVLEELQKVYGDIKGRHPDRFTPPKFRTA